MTIEMRCRSSTPIRIVLCVFLFAFASLESSFGKKLTITSDPSNAGVRLDGKYVGNTPLTFRVKGSDMLDSSGTRWTKPQTLVISKLGCAPRMTGITRDVLDSETMRFQLDCFQPHAQAGFQFLQKDQFADSAREYERALQLDPNQFEAIFNLGAAYMHLARYQDAKKTFVRASELNPDSVEALNMSGLASAKLHQHDDSISFFKGVLHLRPNFAEAYFNLAGQYRAMGHYDEALATVEQATRLDHSFAEAFSLKAEILEQKGRTSDALAAAQQGLRLKPNSAEANSVYGWELDEAGQSLRALPYTRRAVQLEPDWAAAYTRMCRTYIEVGQYSDALRACHDALERAPDDPEGFYYQALVYERLRKRSEALAAFRGSAEAFRKAQDIDGYGFYLLGNDYYRLGQLDKAAENYGKAIEQRPSLGVARLNLGIAYVHLGRETLAVEQYNALKSTDEPRAERLRKLIEQYEAARNETGVQSQSGSSLQGGSARGIEVRLKCEVDCSVRIDKIQNLQLSAGLTKSVPLTPGQHSIFATSATGEQKWQSTFTIYNSSRKEIFIPLGTSRPDSSQEKERKEVIREIARVRAQIDANNAKTVALEEQRRMILERQQARLEAQNQRQQRAEAIVNRIKSYEAEVEAESVLSKQADSDAQRSCSQRAGQSNYAAIAGLASCALAQQAAESHKKRVKELIDEMDELSHELYVLTKPT